MVAIIITAIICTTLVLLSIIGTIDKQAKEDK